MKAKAFTLIELLVYLSIAAIISTLAIPSLLESNNKHLVKIHTDKLKQYLTFSKLQAIHRHKSTTLCSSHDKIHCAKGRHWSNRHILIFIDSNNNRLVDNNEPLLFQSEKINKNIAITWRSFGNKSYLKWLNNGMTDYQNGSFTVCHHNKIQRIAQQLIVNAAGRIYYAQDKNSDGIVDSSQGSNIQCL